MNFWPYYRHNLTYLYTTRNSYTMKIAFTTYLFVYFFKGGVIIGEFV